jgi:hypothetical protein
MTTAKLNRVEKSSPEKEEAAALSPRFMLQLARVVIVAMLSALGFLLNGYVGSLNKTLDNMAVSIGKIGDTQERLAIMLARVDENVRGIDQRLSKNENRIERFENKKP